MGNAIKYLFRYVMAVVFLFLCLAAWLTIDGLKDQGEKANSALVVSHSDAWAAWKGLKVAPNHEGLDHAITLYQDKNIDFIMVTGSTLSSPGDQEAMAQYLISQGIPANMVFKIPSGWDLQAMGSEVAETLKKNDSDSVIIIADYYNIVPTKLALVHANLTQIGKAHMGTFQVHDAADIVRGAFDLCEYISKAYVLPVAQKAKEEAQSGFEKAKVDADQAKQNVDKKLDSMSK